LCCCNPSLKRATFSPPSGIFPRITVPLNFVGAADYWE